MNEDFLQSTLEIADDLLMAVKSSTSPTHIPPISLPKRSATLSESIPARIPNPRPLLYSWGYRDNALSALSDTYLKHAEKLWLDVDTNYRAACNKLSSMPSTSTTPLAHLQSRLYTTMVSKYYEGLQRLLQNVAPSAPCYQDADFDPTVGHSFPSTHFIV